MQPPHPNGHIVQAYHFFYTHKMKSYSHPRYQGYGTMFVFQKVRDDNVVIVEEIDSIEDEVGIEPFVNWFHVTVSW